MMSFDYLWNVMKKGISTYFLPEKCTFKVDLGSNALAI